MPLKITVDSPMAGTRQINLDGSLDSQTSSELEELIVQTIAPDIHCVIMNFTHLEYISSAGIRVVLKVQQMMRKRQGHAFALGLQPQIKKVFEIVQAMPTASIFSSVQELDEYLLTMQQKMVNE